MEEDLEFGRCWACDNLVAEKLDNLQFTRLEKHHIFGRDIKRISLDLCIDCHNLVDRYSLNHISVFAEYMKVIDELEKMPRGKYKILKLFVLRTIKLIIDYDNGKPTHKPKTE